MEKPKTPWETRVAKIRQVDIDHDSIEDELERLLNQIEIEENSETKKALIAEINKLKQREVDVRKELPL